MRKIRYANYMIFKIKFVDLKSPARKGVPVRFRLRAPSKIKGLRAKADASPCLFSDRHF